MMNGGRGMGPPPGAWSNDAMLVAARFRFLPAEVEEMEARLKPLQNPSANHAVVEELARKFSASAQRVGSRVVIHPKQVKTWFSNRRYYSREGKAARAAQAQEKTSAPVVGAYHLAPGSSAAVHAGSSSGSSAMDGATIKYEAKSTPGSSSMDGTAVKYEAKSVRDGAWYDIDDLVYSRMSESGEEEVMVKFSGFGEEENEWVNSRTCVRRRSFPFRSSDCQLVKLRHHVLCYKETQQSGLYFDAQVHARKVIDHGPEEECDCTFLVRYDHDQSEEIVCLRKLCGRPETYEVNK